MVRSGLSMKFKDLEGTYPGNDDFCQWMIALVCYMTLEAKMVDKRSYMMPYVGLLFGLVRWMKVRSEVVHVGIE